MGKKKVGKKKMEKEDEEDDKTRTDEAEAPQETEEDAGIGLGDEDMTDLMKELEGLFKEIDWEALSQEEEEYDPDAPDDEEEA